MLVHVEPEVERKNDRVKEISVNLLDSLLIFNAMFCCPKEKRGIDAVLLICLV